MNKLHDWLIAATTIARISTDAHALGKEITWLRREAHVKGECLEMAVCALRGAQAETILQGIADTITTALVGIEHRLAQLEPEEETG